MNALHCYITVVILLYIDLTVFGQAPVEYEPEFLEDLENHTVAQGRDVSFTCVVNHLGTYKVAWIKSDSKAILAIHTHLVAHNNRLSVTHNGHNTWRLKVANVQKNDSGTYMCQINTDPMKSQMGHLEVVVPPDILNEGGDEDHIAIEGGTVKLKCRATGSPEPRVTWKRDDSKDIVFRNEQSRNKVVKSFEGEVLQLSNVQRTDMGSYYCMANNGVPPIIRKSFLIQIHFHPVVKVSNQLVAAPVGSDVHIQCYVETSPKAMHEWFKDTGEKLMEGPKFEMTETQVNEYTLFLNLTIRVLDKRDFGSYTCSSSSAMGDAKGTIRLQELHIPKTTIAPVINVNEAHKPRKKPATHSKDHLNHGRNRNNKKKQALEDILLPEETGDEKKVATTPESRVVLPFPTYRTPPWTLLKEKVSSSEALSVNMLLPLFLIFLLVRL